MKKCVIEVGTWGGKYNSEILIDKEKINEFKKFIEKKNPFEDVGILNIYCADVDGRTHWVFTDEKFIDKTLITPLLSDEWLLKFNNSKLW